jgi:signal transduction histidine kinase
MTAEISKKIIVFSFTALLVFIFSHSIAGHQLLQQNTDALQRQIKEAETRYTTAHNNGNINEEAEALFQIGICWKDLLVYDKANEYLIRSQKIYEELGQNVKIARNFLFLGDLYRAIAEYKAAEDYLKKALSLYESENNKDGIGRACERLAAAYYETSAFIPNRIDSTFLFAARALAIFKENRNDSLTSSAMNILGASYVAAGKNAIAIAYLNDALKFAEEKKYNGDEALIKCNLSFAYYNLKEYQKSIELAKQTFDYAVENKILPFIDMSCLSLYRNYEDLGDFKNAYKYIHLYDVNRWELYDDNRIHRIKALQIKYETEKKEIEYAHERKTTLMWTAVLLIIIAAGIGVIAISISRNSAMRKKNVELENKNALISEQNIKLTELNATKDKLFSIIGHDLKNPYQSLIGFSNILIQDYKELSEEELKEFVGYIFEASEMGNRLLQNLLDWSRSETGRLKYEPEQFLLYEIINEAINLAANTTMQKEINIISSIPDDQEVFCDRNMVYTVLRNLVSNAIKFSYRGGVIKIFSEVKDSFVEVSVADSGVGMTNTFMEDLFKLEKRVTKDGTENEKGTGLGLYLCKEFIEKNHGTIRVISEPGKGSTFVFTLPARNNV